MCSCESLSSLLLALAELFIDLFTSDPLGVDTSSLELLTELDEDEDLDLSAVGAEEILFLVLLLVRGVPALLGGAGRGLVFRGVEACSAPPLDGVFEGKDDFLVDGTSLLDEADFRAASPPELGRDPSARFSDEEEASVIGERMPSSLDPPDESAVVGLLDDSLLDGNSVISGLDPLLPSMPAELGLLARVPSRNIAMCFLM